jgi:hypothetical protein
MQAKPLSQSENESELQGEPVVRGMRKIRSQTSCDLEGFVASCSPTLDTNLSNDVQKHPRPFGLLGGVPRLIVALAIKTRSTALSVIMCQQPPKPNEYLKHSQVYSKSC